MADAYWRYTSGGQQQAAPAAPASLAPFVAKRPRSEYELYFGVYSLDDPFLWMGLFSVQGEIIQENARIEGEIVEFYQSLYTETVHWTPAYQFPNCLVLSTVEMERMQGSFEEEEVLRCVKMCSTDKTRHQGLMVLPWDSLSNAGKW
ncbi:hypothetical protein MTR67_027428 [Solanum verrucosum]|uniref:Uncharacterized protein n=1 Tax=Solanum verrucosum TaxID=315347 RepID=A0AAF0U051_SOLVR|nr:hypothetical protein MTR67_027428 [Solanum verrucosum]